MSTVIYRTNVNFFTAYNYLIDKLIFTINNKPIELQYSDKVCLVHLDDMISDIVVKGLLPKKSGGIESQNVMEVYAASRTLVPSPPQQSRDPLGHTSTSSDQSQKARGSAASRRNAPARYQPEHRRNRTARHRSCGLSSSHRRPKMKKPPGYPSGS